jgi:hypothetical protein
MVEPKSNAGAVMKAHRTAAVVMPETPALSETPKAGRAAVVVKLFEPANRTVKGADREYLERMGRWHQRRYRRQRRLGYLGR